MIVFCIFTYEFFLLLINPHMAISFGFKIRSLAISFIGPLFIFFLLCYFLKNYFDVITFELLRKQFIYL